jgi:serine O-acetyltransferase
VDKAMMHVKRHPTVQDHVVIYSGATILGGETVIGDHSIIGGNVWLTKSVPSHSTVYHKPMIQVIKNKIVE